MNCRVLSFAVFAAPVCGVYQGCTLSTGLFNTLFNIILDALAQPEFKHLGFRLITGHDPPQHDPTKGYADDVTLLAENGNDCQRLINRFEEMLGWTGTMRLKPVKCRSLAMRHFKDGQPVTVQYNVTGGTTGSCTAAAATRTVVYTPAQQSLHSSFDPQLTAGGQPIKFIGNDSTPFKFLGMYVSHDMSDEFARNKLATTLNTLLQQVDQRPLNGWMKVWLYNYYVAPKLSWLLMIYDFPLSIIEELEATCNRYLKRWLGLAHGASPKIMYVKIQNHGVGIHSIVTLFKRLQAIKLLLMANSRDPAIRRTYQHQKQRLRSKTRKFDPYDTVDQHESFSANAEALTELRRQRTGLGHPDRNRQQRPPSAAARRSAVSERIADMDNDERLRQLHELQIQGQFVAWDNLARNDFRWQQLFAGKISDRLFKFHLNAQLQTLPSEANKNHWRMLTVGSVCRLRHPVPDGSPGNICGKELPTEMHVLCNCTAALEQGRYMWRHDSALLVLKSALIGHLDDVRSGRVKVEKPRDVKFRSADTRRMYNDGKSAPALQPTRLREWFALATDWTLKCDLPGDTFSYDNRVFPPRIAAISERPDITLISEDERVAICLELTVPKEERIQTAHDLKAAKYAELPAAAAANGWRLVVVPIEVGARGFVAQSTYRALHELGFSKKRAAAIKEDLSLVVTRCSYYLFQARNSDVWQQISLLPAARLAPQQFSENHPHGA